MTTTTITCAGCGRELAVPERYLGRELKCPKCGRPFRAEALRVAPPPAQTPAPAGRPAAAPFESAPFEEPAAPAPAAPSADADGAPAQAGAGAPVYWRVTRIGVRSLAALSALLHAVLGLVLGVVVAIASFTPAAQAIPFLPRPLLGALALVAFPLAYAAVGFVAGAVTAVVYNLGARLVGGVAVLLE